MSATPQFEKLLPEIREVLENPDLDAAGRLEQLKQLETDARRAAVAAGEGMAGEDPRQARRLREVHLVREWLEARG